ncbi:hypothetical protein ACIBK9_33855 [Nonomuraea sp. NPDC050227]|uniref:hypothetical protein n=1 Tax=Nonomuraea sp. NPDC050227 TaxID=3364360 RepID=UPI00379FE549
MGHIRHQAQRPHPRVDERDIGGCQEHRIRSPRPGEVDADLFVRLRGDLRRQATADSAETGIIAWAAAHVRLDGAARLLPAGIDGETVELHRPATCDIRPGALRLLLPRRRPGLPPA